MVTGTNEWLAESRQTALAVFRALPLPDRASHLWRYSDPADFLPPGEPGGSGAGLASAAVSSIEAPDGVVAVSLEDASRSHLDVLRDHLGGIVPAEMGKCEALSLGLWSAGFLVRVPRGMECERPVRITTALGSASSSGAGSGVGAGFGAVRNVIILEEGASATIIEDATGDDPKGARRCEATEIYAGPGSRVRLVSLQRLGRNATLHRTQRVRLEREAQASIVMASVGSAAYKADIGVILDGKGSESRMIGLCFGDGKQRADHHTLQDHRGAHTQSDIDFRVVLGGRARSAYTGLIRIAKEAPYCEAYQENRNLLLSDNARAESIPELEILTDEVRCKHGATVGPIDKDQLFYIQSRGLTAPEATRMVVTGFLEQTLAHIPEGAAAPIREELDRRLLEVVRR